MSQCSTKHTKVYFVLQKGCLWVDMVQLDTLFSFLCTLGKTTLIIDYKHEEIVFDCKDCFHGNESTKVQTLSVIHLCCKYVM